LFCARQLLCFSLFVKSPIGDSRYDFGIWVAFLMVSKANTLEDAMAKVIEFHIPARFHKQMKWIPQAQRGKVLEFPAEVRKSA
jgi:hypothetical protein